MKKVLFFAAVLLCVTPAFCDQINFNFTTGANGSVSASKAGGVIAGPSELTSISDSTTSVIDPFAGTFVDGDTGPASSFVIGSLVIATFTAAGADSVFVIGTGTTILVSGDMRDGASLLSTFPAGTGSFLGTFNVTFVNPTALALFGLGPAFDPVGSVAFTFANADVANGVLTADIGGGAVTIQTPAPTPELGTLILMGSGCIGLFLVGRRGYAGLS